MSKFTYTDLLLDLTAWKPDPGTKGLKACEWDDAQASKFEVFSHEVSDGLPLEFTSREVAERMGRLLKRAFRKGGEQRLRDLAEFMNVMPRL